MSTVTIFHNISTDAQGRSLGMLDGYTDGHPLVPVFRYTDLDHRKAERTLEAAFHTFNVGAGAKATSYRAKKNRSFSVGDVIAIDDTYWACSRWGWDEVSTPKWFAAKASTHGTTPLDI